MRSGRTRARNAWAFLVVWGCLVSGVGGVDDSGVKLKRVLFLFSAASLEDARALKNSKLVSEDSDTVALVCTKSEVRETNFLEVTLPYFFPSRTPARSPGWRGRRERVFKVGGSDLEGVDIYVVHECASESSELILLLAAASKQRYAFYIPVNTTDDVHLIDLPSALPTKYTNRNFRLEMVKFSAQALEKRLHTLLSSSSQQTAADQEQVEFEEAPDTDDQAEDARTRRERRRFVYLLTGEKESEFKDLDRMVGPDADVILCVWGEPEDEREKECWEECTGDWPKVCRQVCVLAAQPPAPPISFLYVRGSSFQQGRNHLLRAAQRVGSYTYYIFLVDDIEVLERDFGTGLATGNPYRTLEGYLIVWQPAMAVPAAVRRDEDVLLDPACEVAPVYGWDHLLHAVHRDAAPILFPYSLGFEPVSWWYSEYIMNLAAAAFFDAGHVLQFHALYAQTFRAGYVGYPHASDFREPLRWFLSALGAKAQLDALHFHEHTCLSPPPPPPPRPTHSPRLQCCPFPNCRSDPAVEPNLSRFCSHAPSIHLRPRVASAPSLPETPCAAPFPPLSISSPQRRTLPLVVVSRAIVTSLCLGLATHVVKELTLSHSPAQLTQRLLPLCPPQASLSLVLAGAVGPRAPDALPPVLPRQRCSDRRRRVSRGGRGGVGGADERDGGGGGLERDGLRLVHAPPALAADFELRQQAQRNRAEGGGAARACGEACVHARTATPTRDSGEWLAAGVASHVWASFARFKRDLP